jgi:hypothetical protein
VPIRIPIVGPHTAFVPVRVRAIAGKVTVKGGPFGPLGHTFTGVSGSFRGVAVTFSRHGKIIDRQLVPVEPTPGGIIR